MVDGLAACRMTETCDLRYALSTPFCVYHLKGFLPVFNKIWFAELQKLTCRVVDPGSLPNFTRKGYTGFMLDSKSLRIKHN